MNDDAMNILINMYKTELLAHRWCTFLILPKCFTGWLFQFTLSSAEQTCFRSPLLWLILSNLEIFAKMICEKYNLIYISIYIAGAGYLFIYLLIRFGLIQAWCKEQVYSCESFSGWLRPANLLSRHLLLAMLCFILIFKATGVLDSPWLYLHPMLRVQKSNLNISSTSQRTWGLLTRISVLVQSKSIWSLDFSVNDPRAFTLYQQLKRKPSSTVWLICVCRQNRVLKNDRWGIKFQWNLP